LGAFDCYHSLHAMGIYRFQVEPPDRLTEQIAQQALLSGIDRGCWPVRSSIENGRLILSRGASESSKLHLPWPVSGRGWVTLVTGSLMESPEPYLLPLELARGTVCQLRNQMADWQGIGLTPPAAVVTLADQAVKQLARAAVRRNDAPVSAQWAEAAIASALDAGDALAAAYVEAAAYSGRRTGTRMTGWLGCDAGLRPIDSAWASLLTPAFSAFNVPIRWRQIEDVEGNPDWSAADRQIQWCREQGAKVCAGPLLLFDPQGLPDWLCLWEGDLESIANFASTFVRSAVQRYRGRVDAWVAAGRVNTGNVLGLSEEDKLRLAAHLIELVASIDPQTPVLVGFDQPWGEYLARRPMDVPPLQYVDAMVQAELKLGGLMWELNIGFHPGGTQARTLFEFSRHLDLWSGFQLPLWISLAVPSGTGPDPQAARNAALLEGSWSPKVQWAFVARYVPMLLAKPYVQGVFWNTLSDAEPHDFANTGLFDAQGQPKQVLRALAAIRQTYLARPHAESDPG